MSSGQYTPGTGGQPDPNGQEPAEYVPAVPDHGPAVPGQQDSHTDLPPSYEPGSTEARPADDQLAETRPAKSHPAEARPAEEPKVTRAGVVWAAVVASLVLLILLIIFILQNQDRVLVQYFGLRGELPLGMALFIASVTGGVLVAAAGGVRILQLRASAHRARAKNRR
ncbi:hypothetical protein PSET11_00158 [Arthrobacter ulcerisalmonis]|uniref:Lipopolysaccharide assembly protein A domain-containing protein n=1 Tax=Arthrobacter ulcerisalmonis TaxID=2483813 RepID=A0A3P5WIB3_9MICC|nr:lipopolysaccharide assembly protein LapA domain-containing protein [Arthrobacter ulcerisalmonis]VDC18292.1 hypothetical protein PSET11_00158 [Arthrobacter ulcerisalmonis]